MAAFFVLIVVIPIAAIALLVVDVTSDADAGKADARLSTALTTALAVYERSADDARAQAGDLLAEPDVQAAIRSGDAGRIRAVTAAAARSRGIEQLTIRVADGPRIRVLNAGEAIATATVRATGASGSFAVSASVTGPTEYVDEVALLTGADAALIAGNEPTAATRPVDQAELPGAGESADVELQGDALRAAAGSLPERGNARVLVIVPSESGGFFSSSPRIAGVVAVFLLIAFGFVFFLVRTLQAQIASMLAAARRIGHGDFSQRVPVVGHDEMAGLASEFNQMSDRLRAQIEQLRRQRMELDRSVRRMGEAFAAGLDRESLLGIVAETALGGCEAQYCRIALDDGTIVERPEGKGGTARDAVVAGQERVASDGVAVDARRGDGVALAAPLRHLDEQVGSIAVARVGEPFNEQEREVFLYLQERASSSIENITVHERVSEQAVTDELTGLPNNRAFRETIDREAARAERFGHQLSLIILDIDDFKAVNDTFGHLQGDEVLRVVGRILEAEPRAIDEPARYGGEEFVVALPETGSAGAVELAERIRERLQTELIPSVDGGDPIRVTASLGTATLPDSAPDVRELFAAADEALYEAKRSGKNRVVTAPDNVRPRR